jgi:hypothetical protein
MTRSCEGVSTVSKDHNCDGSENSALKRAYERPFLKTLGALSRLTQGGKGTRADGVHYRHNA